MANVPFILITGFLGSGKTTFLKRILERYSGEKKLAIVQNEFSDTGIDGTDLRQAGHAFELLEINKGSVFCVCLLSDFKKSLSAFCDAHQPDAVLFEASELADPLAVAQILEAPELKERLYLHRVFCVVDAVNFLFMEKRVGRIAHQIFTADHILLNKTDLADETALNGIRVRLMDMNPLATLEIVSQASADLERFLDPPRETPVAARNSDRVRALEACGRPDLESVAVRIAKPMSESALRRFMEAEASRCIRIKGFVKIDDGRTLMVQQTPEAVVYTPIQADNIPTQLIAIGPGLNGADFRRRFESMV